MKEQKTLLEFQQDAAHSQDVVDVVYDEYARGETTRQEMEDREQIAQLRLQRADRERQEALDRATGRVVNRRERFRRSVTKFLLG